MATVLEGLISSRRRPSRSRSESGKQLHARWGDSAITAPTDGGWSQQYMDDEQIYQSHGSPDSQRTLVNTSPDLAYAFEQDKFDRFNNFEVVRQASPQLGQKERSAITITIPLPWSRKSHRRSSSGSSQQASAVSSAVSDKAIAVESRPALTSNITTNIDQVIVAESRPAVSDLFVRSDSPIIQTQSPVYDDVSTFFTRAAFPEKRYGAPRLPQIQTAVPQNRSQPASALSILSPVAEKYDDLSESNNNTPMESTPIAQHVVPVIPVGSDGVIDVTTLKSRLEQQQQQPRAPSAGTTDVSDSSESELPYSRPTTSEGPSRPSSRGIGLGQVAYMRASSRGAASDRQRSASRGATEGGRHRSASRDSSSRRPGSVEPLRRRALSREVATAATSNRSRVDLSEEREYEREQHTRALSRTREPSGERSSRRALSQEPVRRRAETPGPVVSPDLTLREQSVPRERSRGPSASRRAHSTDPSRDYRSVSPPVTSRRALSRGEPVLFVDRVDSPSPPLPSSRRPRTRDTSFQREISPVTLTRRAISREPVTRRRLSVDFSRRAASVDPIRRRASPREDVEFVRRPSPLDDIIPRRASPAAGARAKTHHLSSGSSFLDDLTSDETTDFETETEEMYFESRKGWNGSADAGVASKGFYGDVTQDYKLIARDVEADFSQTQPSPPATTGMGINIVTIIKKDKEPKIYGGPDLVPNHEELWG